jgi:hypothetical protein
MKKQTNVKLPFFLGYAFLFCWVMAHAETRVTPTLEWLADHCIDSGIYVVSEVQAKEQKNHVNLKLMLKRVFRGEPAKEIGQDYVSDRLKRFDYFCFVKVKCRLKPFVSLWAFWFVQRGFHKHGAHLAAEVLKRTSS